MKTLRKYTPWTLLLLVLLYIVTGYGITQYRIVESITFGLLTKALSFKIHNGLVFFFVPVLFLHVYLAIVGRIKNEK